MCYCAAIVPVPRARGGSLGGKSVFSCFSSHVKWLQDRTAVEEPAALDLRFVVAAGIVEPMIIYLLDELAASERARRAKRDEKL